MRPAAVAPIVLHMVLAGCSSPQDAPAGTATGAMTPTAVAVPFATGNAGFAPGDLVTVTSVKGTSATIDDGGAYTVEGTWTLDSRDAATLALYSTNGELRGTQSIHVARGSGTFSFTTTIVRDGFLHVSYYPSDGGTSFGGAYFGTGSGVYRGSYVPGAR